MDEHSIGHAEERHDADQECTYNSGMTKPAKSVRQRA
jgi:hypothetical protein